MSRAAGENGRRVGPWVLGSTSLAYFAGIATHRAASEHALPVESFEWILRNGVAGLALAVAVVSIWLYLQERNARNKEKDAYTEKVEALTREAHQPLVPLIHKLTRVVTINSEVIRSRTISEEQLEELRGDTPDDPGTKLGESSS